MRRRIQSVWVGSSFPPNAVTSSAVKVSLALQVVRPSRSSHSGSNGRRHGGTWCFAKSSDKLESHAFAPPTSYRHGVRGGSDNRDRHNRSAAIAYELRHPHRGPFLRICFA